LNHDLRYASTSGTSDILHVRGFMVETIGKVGENSSLTGAWNRTLILAVAILDMFGPSDGYVLMWTPSVRHPADLRKRVPTTSSIF
jgi:hypothetical protein